MFKTDTERWGISNFFKSNGAPKEKKITNELVSKIVNTILAEIIVVPSNFNYVYWVNLRDREGSFTAMRFHYNKEPVPLTRDLEDGWFQTLAKSIASGDIKKGREKITVNVNPYNTNLNGSVSVQRAPSICARNVYSSPYTIEAIYASTLSEDRVLEDFYSASGGVIRSYDVRTTHKITQEIWQDFLRNNRGIHRDIDEVLDLHNATFVKFENLEKKHSRELLRHAEHLNCNQKIFAEALTQTVIAVFANTKMLFQINDVMKLYSSTGTFTIIESVSNQAASLAREEDLAPFVEGSKAINYQSFAKKFKSIKFTNKGPYIDGYVLPEEARIKIEELHRRLSGS